VKGTGVTNWWSDGVNVIAFGRGDRGFAAINRSGVATTRTFQTSMPAGTYCDVQHGTPGGSCTNYTIDGSGRFTATVGAGDAVTLYR
jgi:alpha-amylase